MLRVNLFGKFEVFRDGAPRSPLDWPRRQTQALLKIFLSDPQRIFTVDQLVDALFPDQEYDKAVKNLQKRISELRKTLEPELAKNQKSSYIESTANRSYRFAPEAPCVVDAHQFRAHIEAAKGFLGDEQPSQALMEFEQALELYRGEYLAEDLYEEWALAPRAEYEELQKYALAAMAQCHAQLRHDQLAVDYCERALQLDPLNESLYQNKMRYHYYAGEAHQALQTYRQCEEVLERELQLKPSQETVELYESLKNHSVSLPAKSIPNNLPFQLTSFIGREEEIAELSQLISTSRLVTLTGVGGTGKTRLAIQLGFRLIHDFEDGVWFIPLGDLESADYIEKQLATTLGIREAAALPLLESLKNYLQKRRLLLILDNCEHVAVEISQLVQRLLTSSSELRILATSRELLHVPGEMMRVLDPLSSPGADFPAEWKKIRDFEAAQLFIERALPQQPGFVVDRENAPVISRICQRLDGIPLAIELAAAQTRTLTLEEILSRLSDRFTLLSSSNRPVLPHHQTLRAAIDWSYELLDERQRSLLHRVSIFGSSFSLEAVEAICCGDGLETTEIYLLLRDLIDKSFIYVDREPDGLRYRQLETLREYALEHLRESGAEESLRSAHRDYFLGLSEEAAPYLKHQRQIEWFERLEREIENIRTALLYSHQAGDIEELVRFGVALEWFWFARGRQCEGRDWLGKASEYAESLSKELKAKLCYNSAALTWNLGEYEETERLAQEALTLCREVGDRWGEAYSLSRLAIVAEFKGSYEQSEDLYKKALAIARAIDDSWLISVLLNNLGEIERRKGKFESAEALVNEGLDLSNESGDTWCSAQLSFSLGVIQYESGNLDNAARLFQDALVLKRELHDRWGVANLLYSLGRVKAKTDSFDDAIALYGESRALYDDLGEQRGYAFSTHWLGIALIKADRYEAALDMLKEAMAIRRDLGDNRGIAESFEGFAALLAHAGRPEIGAQLTGCAKALRNEVGAPLSPADRADSDLIVDELEQVLGKARSSKLRSEGAKLSPDAALELAMGIEL